MRTCNKDNMLKVVEALESGQYEQGRRYLQMNGKYCCMGVMCEVAIANGVEVSRNPSDLEEQAGIVAYDGGIAYLPQGDGCQ